MKRTTASRGAEAGFALYIVMATMAVLSIAAFGVIRYSVFAMRSTASMTRTSECRLAAASVLEQAKVGINQTFIRFRRANPGKWDVLEWFDNFTETSVGSGTFFYALPQNQEENGFTVSVRIVAVDQSNITAAYQRSTLRIQSTATGTTGGGDTVTKTLEEVVEFGLRRSGVFDYAYFVNNFGYILGGSCTANGDVRSNGDFRVDALSYINGHVLAAPNEENGAKGRAFVDGGGTPRHMTLEEFWAESKKCDDRSRPTNPPGTNPDVDYPMGYDGESYLYSYQDPLEMPYLGDLQLYKNLAVGHGGTISQGGETLVDAVFDGTGPSDVSNAPDKGCITLFGTKQNPIVIDGPVVVERDVVISGYVTGQGTIYAGRNVHIIGDVTYVNPPAWEKPNDDPDAAIEENRECDLLGLVAKGNIVLGNPQNSSWINDVSPYMKPPFTKPYACDPTDASIGYPTVFNGNYTAQDGLQRVVSVTSRREKIDGKQVIVKTATTEPSRYYKSLVQDSILQGQYSYTITKVDAVLYNNHGIIGKVGNCDINGAFVCRDDALMYQAALDLSWDIRLGSRSRDAVDLFIFLPVVVGDPSVVGWKEVYP